MLSRMLPAALLAMAVAAPAQAQFVIPASAVTLTMSPNADCALAPGEIVAFNPEVMSVTLTNPNRSSISSFSMRITLHGTNVPNHPIYISSDRQHASRAASLLNESLGFPKRLGSDSTRLPGGGRRSCRKRCHWT